MGTTELPTRTDTVIIGAGQAGLATGKLLADRERSFVILDALDRVGDNWRRHYDSLRLYNPAPLCSLPGLAFPGTMDDYPTRDEVADYLERYAATFDLPVRTGVTVQGLRRVGDTWQVDTGGHVIEADDVVVATGTFGKPWTPPFAPELDPGIVQLHSSEYRNPSQLQPGPVLVVGAAHSGADIAYELAHHHDVVLAGRDTGEVPFRIETSRARRVWPVLSFVARKVLTIRTPIGRKVRPKIRAHGGPLIRYRTSDLVDVGVERVTDRVTGVEGGRPVLGDGRVLDVANVVWCTGFQQDLTWIEPSVTDETGWPRERRGVATDVPGLYFMGLAFQYAFGSMLFVGVSQDAQHVVDHLTARDTRHRASATAA